MRKTLFETQVLTGFQYMEGVGYVVQIAPAPFELKVGETYIIELDGDSEFPRTAFAFDSFAPGMVAVGNDYPVTGVADPDNLPVIVGYDPNENYVGFVALVAADELEIGIYQEAEEKIILRDPDGTEQEYPMRPMLEVDTTEGGTVLYSKGQILDGLTIQPDFSAGDMEITAPDGYLVKNAVVAKPEDCEPENILKGKNIGGIPGELEVPVLTQGRIEPDFSGGDMLYVPGDGNAFSAVTIVKPENLKPENIREGEKVAGVDGGLQAATKDVSTAAEMDALLTEANVGKVYRYTGETTEIYISGDIYIVEASS